MRHARLYACFLIAILAALLTLGCELVVDFDRSLIPGDTDASVAMDGAVIPGVDGALDSTPAVDAPNDSQDAPSDAPNDADGGSDAADAGDAADASDAADAAPGVLTNVSVTPGSLTAGASGSVVVAFTTAQSWPATGKVDVGFPAGFDVSAATFVTQTGSSGSFVVGVAGQTISLTRSGGTATSGAVNLTLGSIHNPAATGTTGTFSVTTRTSANGVIDVASAVPGVAIVPGALNAPSVSPVLLTAGALGNVDVGFTTLNPWPATGLLEVTFPAGFDVSAATFVSQTGSDGSFAASLLGQVVRLTRSGGTVTNGAVTLRIGQVRNPRVSGSTGTYLVTTLASAGVVIDSASAPASTILPGALASASVTPGSLSAGAVGQTVVSFTPTNPLPANGKLDVVFSAGFDVSGATFLSQTGSSGGFSVSVAGQTVTVTRDGAGTASSGSITITLGAVGNPPISGATASHALTTRTNAGVSIDTGTAGGSAIISGSISGATVAPASLVDGAVGNVTAGGTTTNPWPANGRLDVVFPAGFDVSGVTFVSQTGSSGGFSVSAVGQTVTVLRDGAGTASNGTLTLTLGSIGNPSVPGTTGTYALTTRSNAGVAIDTGTAAASAIVAGSLTGVSVTPASLVAGDSGNVTASFTTPNPWPANGRFDVAFPTGFDVTLATFVSQTGSGGGFSASIVGQTVTVIRDGAGSASTGAITLTLGGVHNPGVSGTTATYGLAMRTGAGVAIDTATASGSAITPGALANASVTPASLVANDTGAVTVSFDTSNPLPADGRVDVVFPAGFDVSGVTFVSRTGPDGGFTVSVVGQTVTVVRDNAGVSFGGTVSITLGNIVNPGIGLTGTYSVTTRTSTSVTIDTGTGGGSLIL